MRWKRLRPRWQCQRWMEMRRLEGWEAHHCYFGFPGEIRSTDGLPEFYSVQLIFFRSIRGDCGAGAKEKEEQEGLDPYCNSLKIRISLLTKPSSWRMQFELAIFDHTGNPKMVGSERLASARSGKGSWIAFSNPIGSMGLIYLLYIIFTIIYLHEQLIIVVKACYIYHYLPTFTIHINHQLNWVESLVDFVFSFGCAIQAMQLPPNQIMVPLRDVKSLQWLYGFWLFESFNECTFSYWLVVTWRCLLIWIVPVVVLPKVWCALATGLLTAQTYPSFSWNQSPFFARKPSQKSPRNLNHSILVDDVGWLPEKISWDGGWAHWFESWRRSQSWEMSAMCISTFSQGVSYCAMLLLPSGSPTNCVETTRPETYPWQDQREPSGDCAFRTGIRL